MKWNKLALEFVTLIAEDKVKKGKKINTNSLDLRRSKEVFNFAFLFENDRIVRS